MTKEEIEKQIHDFTLRINSIGFLDGYAKGLNDRKKEVEKAKREGYDEGVTDTIFNTDTYIQGLNDAWECARKIMQLPNDTQELFYLSAEEAIAKIKEYEENNNNSKTDDLLKEGDEIIILDHNSDYHNKKGIITYVSDCGEYIEVLFSDGDFGKYCNGYFKRTGKSYPELANILEQLKGDNI